MMQKAALLLPCLVCLAITMMSMLAFLGLAAEPRRISAVSAMMSAVSCGDARARTLLSPSAGEAPSFATMSSATTASSATASSARSAQATTDQTGRPADVAENLTQPSRETDRIGDELVGEFTPDVMVTSSATASSATAPSATASSATSAPATADKTGCPADMAENRTQRPRETLAAGTIPAEIGKLTSLQTAILQYTQLSGTILAVSCVRARYFPLPITRLVWRIAAVVAAVAAASPTVAGTETCRTCPWVQDPSCMDSSTFIDAWGYACHEWAGYECGGHPISDELFANCPVACRMCQPRMFRGECVDRQVASAPAGSQKHALRVLYNATGGSNWKLSEGAGNNWCIDGCHCDWTGVVCHGAAPPDAGACDDSYPVRSIEIQAKKLVGTLPTELSSLTGLQGLDLSFNSLSGSLPEAFGKLSEMRDLYLYSNGGDDGSLGLSGTFPAAWANMTKIRGMSLHNNSLSGTLPGAWANMTQMLLLGLDTNFLSGSLPAAWSSMIQLQALSLHANRLSGLLPEAWGSMAQMQVLDLSGLGRSLRLSGTLPEAWANMTNMVSLRVEQNSLSGSLPEAWAAMTQMQQIRMNENRLRGTLPAAWAAMTKMQEVQLFINLLSGTLPETWATMERMMTLDMYNSRLSGPLPKTWGNMAQMGKLDLHNNMLRGALPEAWANMTQMRYLMLDSNNLTGPLPGGWSSMAQMQLLRLHQNGLTGVLPDSWATMNQLVIFYLHENRLSGTLPSAWENMTHMRELVLRSNARVSGTLPEMWSNLGVRIDDEKNSTVHDLQVLDVSSMAIRGTLPGTWANHAKLRTLYLHENRLHGTIPIDWGLRMTDLQVFAAQYNKLHGTIPTALLESSTICILLLNDNAFRGRIAALSSSFQRKECLVTTGATTLSAFRPALMLHNNHLSCALPRLSGGSEIPRDPGIDELVSTCNISGGRAFGSLKPLFLSNSLLLPGNRFDGDVPHRGTGLLPEGRLPDWVYAPETGDPMANYAPFLFLHSGSWYSIAGGAVLSAALAYVGSGLVLLCAVVLFEMWKQRRRQLQRPDGAEPPRASAATPASATHSKDAGKLHPTVRSTHSLVTRHLVMLSALALLLLLPAYGVGSGGYFECGDGVLKTTSAYLADSTNSEILVAVVFMAVSALSVGTMTAVHLLPFYSSHQQLDASQVVGGRTALDGPTSFNKQTFARRKHSCSGLLCRPGALLLWSIGLTILSIPSFVYALSDTLPTGDTIFGKDFENLFGEFRRFAPLLITVINALAIPKFASLCSNLAGWRHEPIGMLVFARALTTWIVPAIGIGIFGNSCGKKWLLLWNQCSDERHTNATNEIALSGSEYVSYRESLSVWAPSAGAESMPGNIVCGMNPDRSPLLAQIIPRKDVLSGDTICGVSQKQRYADQYAECPRSIVDSLASLLMVKLANTAFLLPAVMLIKLYILPGGGKKCMKRVLQKSCIGQRVAALGGVTKRTYCRCCSGKKKKKKNRPKPNQTQEKVDTAQNLRLDRKIGLYITWLQVALIFGPHAPLILPLLVACLLTNRWAHEQALRHHGLVESHIEDAQTYQPGKPLAFAVICQQALMVALFYGSDFAGKEVVACASLVAGICSLTIALVPASRLQIPVQRASKWVCACRAFSGGHCRLSPMVKRRYVPWLFEDGYNDARACGATPPCAVLRPGTRNTTDGEDASRPRGNDGNNGHTIVMQMVENPSVSQASRHARLGKMLGSPVHLVAEERKG